MLGGGTLALYGLTRRSVGGVALTLLGGGLIYRAITMNSGHLLEALGMPAAQDLAPAMSIPNDHGVKSHSEHHHR